jgi:hypothetical protein
MTHHHHFGPEPREFCICTRHQLVHVGCDCGSVTGGYDFDRADLQCEAEGENAWFDRDRRERDAEDAYYFGLQLQDAAWTYQGGW